MTLLKFLSAAAGAGIVSPDLGRVAFDLACCSVAAILVGHYEFLLAPAPFDLLHWNGRDLTGVPLEERKRELKRLVPVK